MGSVSHDGVGGLEEPNHSEWNGQNGMKNDEVAVEEQTVGYSEEDEQKVKGVVGQVDEKLGEGPQVSENGHNLHQHIQGPIIRWERFLPFRSLRVLLVENDDSTRQVVSALLRNCSYEVTAVPNGLQAWKVLEDFTNHIDLILTEVAMPVISGIALLYKIMNHKTFKNIPVIMMSSHDSMGIVFKCLSKGAVDFLVKPIRKNELKNLWQHVWKRCHSSSGSGSESGTQSRRSTGTKVNCQSQENSSSSGEQECGSIGLSLHDGSDDGSGAQSSWTKRAAVAVSPPPTGAYMADAPDSTCAQVNHTKPETISNSRVPFTVTEVIESPEQDGHPESKSPGKDLDVEISSDPLLDSDRQLEGLTEQLTVEKHKSVLDLELLPVDVDTTATNINTSDASKFCLNLTSTNLQVESGTYDPSNGYSNFSFKDKTSSELRGIPSLDLKLERSGGSDIPTTVQNDCNVLGHSDLSAFSKYISGPSSSQKDSIRQPVKLGKTDDPAVNSSQMESKDLNQVYVEHHHHHYHHYHHHVHDLHKHKPPKDPNKCLLKETPLVAPQCGSSNAFSKPMEVSPGNYSLNGSGSGSNHGSNGQNGGSSLIPLNAGTTNIGSDNAMPVNSGGGNCKGKVGGNGSDEDRFALREAALTKFRQKRKERCFEKKVRYQSRKKLAEQRPRVRGQFVRHDVCDEKAGQETQSDGLTPGDNSCDGAR